MVITAVADDHGNEYVVSRLGDKIWDLAPEIEAKNRNREENTIAWPQNAPRQLVDDAKAALYLAFRRGPHARRWSASGVVTAGSLANHVLGYLASLGLQNFSEVRALIMSDYIADMRQRMRPGSARHRLEIVRLVWSFPLEMIHPLPENPWAGRTLNEACGCNEDDDGPAGRTGKTPVIPRSVQRKLFAYCEARLDDADELLLNGSAEDTPDTRGKMIAARDAALYLLQISSGMRNSESTEITSGCWRTEERNGTVFHWLRTREIKTTGGTLVDFLIPPEAIRALEFLQLYAKPLQARLADEARWLEQQLDSRSQGVESLDDGTAAVKAVARLIHVRKIANHLLLGINSRASDHTVGSTRVEVLTATTCWRRLSQLSRSAGTNWSLANHQCRRTFAYNVANSRLGRMGLIFLKWQLKHASISWTQLYASNPFQDHSLYREFEDEMADARLSLLEGWAQPDARLSGGAGKKILQTRAKAARDLHDLLRMTAESVELRSTGHAWCISGTRGCHGQGVYDPAMCSTCSQAVIDESQVGSWQMIHLDNLRLAAITDCGPAVLQKATRAIERSTQVLTDLGVPLPEGNRYATYARLEKLS